MQEVVGSSPIISKNAEGLSVILSPIKCNCEFTKNRLPEYAPSRCEGKAARMPPTAYGGALRKAQEAPERRGRFKSDHLQKRGSLSLILSHIKFNCKFVKNRLPKYAPSRCEGKAAGMPLMYLPKNGDFNYLTQRRRMC